MKPSEKQILKAIDDDIEKAYYDGCKDTKKRAMKELKKRIRILYIDDKGIKEVIYRIIDEVLE